MSSLRKDGSFDMHIPSQGHELVAWHSFDVRSILPPNGLQEILNASINTAVTHEMTPQSVTSREADLTPIPLSSLDGVAVDQELPWIRPLYLGAFRQLVQRVTPEPIITGQDQRSSIVVNVQGVDNKQRGYECHVDSNPVTALLYATSHPPGPGGELVISNRGDVSSRDEVDADATRIYPIAGHLVVFGGRRHTHYVSPMSEFSNSRVAVVMNYYTPSVTEDERPNDLDGHLFGEIT